MAYLPDHKADVFISYSHQDNFVWIEGFKQELEKALRWKLRAATKPEIFFDTETLRAGRVFNQEIADCLRSTEFFLAIVSQRYNSSTYCRHQELGEFLKHKPPPRAAPFRSIWTCRLSFRSRRHWLCRLRLRMNRSARQAKNFGGI